MGSGPGDAPHDNRFLEADGRTPAAGASNRRPVALAVLLTTLFWLTVGGAWAVFGRRPQPVAFAIQPPPATSTPLPTPTPAPIVVEVSGAVRKPGVYELSPAGRVEQAIAAAGGLALDADAGQLNLAQPMYDGQRLVVPAVVETPLAPPSSIASRSTTIEIASPSGQAAASQGNGAALNVNTATAEQLDALPGIGPVIAQAIIDYREANGPFLTVESLLNVKGIGKATLAKFRDLITVQ